MAKTLRTGLATATKDPYFDSATFGKELTRYLVAPLLNEDEQEWADEHVPGMTGGAILGFMMRDVDYGPEFLKSAADELAYFEKQSEDGFMPATVWYAHNGPSPFNEGQDTADPMAEMMRAMSRQPEVGYDFIREEGNADYFFDKRDWSQDGYDGISALADRVSTDPDIYEAHPREAAMIASQFVDWTADSPGFNNDDAKAASDSVESPALLVHALDGRRHGRRRRGPRSLDPGRRTRPARATASWTTCRSSSAATSPR